jgi:translation initiation factor RLI1
MKKKNGNFTLNIKPGMVYNSQITILLGQNGTGKTTLMKILSGKDSEFFSNKTSVKHTYTNNLYIVLK